MKTSKKILLIVIIVLILIQFVRPEKNVSTQTSPNDITFHYHVPADVKEIRAKACDDCHSNNTRYPWYANFQPVAWWLNSHVVDGKHDLNFSEFGSYRIGKQYRKMKEVVSLVKKDNMPLASYTLIHKDAELNAAEKEKLVLWAESVRDTIRVRFPADSLIGKK